MAVLVEVALVYLVSVDFSCQHPPDILQVDIEIVRVADGLEIACQQFFRRIAEKAAQRRIDLQPLAIQGDDSHADGGIAHRLAQCFLAFPLCQFSLLAPRHIRDGTGHAQGLAVLAADDLSPRPHPDMVAGSVPQAVFNVIRRVVFQVGFQGGKRGRRSSG